MSGRDAELRANTTAASRQASAATTATLGAVFSELASLALRLTDEHGGPGVGGGAFHLGLDSRAGDYVACTNCLCTYGGYHFLPALRDMVDARAATLDTFLFCDGRESSPRGGRVYRRCAHALHVRAEATYRDALPHPGSNAAT